MGWTGRFLKSPGGFFQPNVFIFAPNGLYQPNKQFWAGEKCRFWNHPFIYTPYWMSLKSTLLCFKKILVCFWESKITKNWGACNRTWECWHLQWLFLQVDQDWSFFSCWKLIILFRENGGYSCGDRSLQFRMWPDISGYKWCARGQCSRH